MKKRLLSLVMAALVLFVFNISVCAEGAVQPRYTYVNTIAARLTVQSGNAVSTGVVTANSSVTSVKVTLKLQKKGILKWNTVTTWTDYVIDNDAEMEYRYGPLDSGKYRVIFEATVYAGSSSETVSATSSTVTV